MKKPRPVAARAPGQNSSPAAFDPAAVGQALALTYSHSGPLPPPQVLLQYNQVIPGGAERILRMAEEDAAVVRLTQRRQQVFLLADRLATRLASLIFAGGALLLSAYLALAGHDTVAGIIAATTIGGVVAAVVIGKAHD